MGVAKGRRTVSSWKKACSKRRGRFCESLRLNDDDDREFFRGRCASVGLIAVPSGSVRSCAASSQSESQESRSCRGCARTTHQYQSTLCHVRNDSSNGNDKQPVTTHRIRKIRRIISPELVTSVSCFFFLRSRIVPKLRCARTVLRRTAIELLRFLSCRWTVR